MAKKIIKKRKAVTKAKSAPKKKAKRIRPYKPGVKTEANYDPRARKCVEEVKKYLRDGRKPNIYRIMLAVGYSKSSAESNTIKTHPLYLEEIPEYVIELQEEREQAIAALPKKRDKAKYRDLTDGIDKLTKVINLATGQATERIIANISDEEKEALDKLID